MTLLCKVWRWFCCQWNPMHVVLSQRRWKRLAATVTRQTFMAWLAEQVVNDIVARKPFGVSIEELSAGVMQYPVSDLQHRAERFIEHYYYGYPSDDPRLFAMLSAFRKMLQQNLLRLLAHE